MKNLLTFLPAFLIASTVVAEPTAAKYFAPKVTTDSGYTQTLLLPDGTLEYVVSFTTVNDETNPYAWQVPANVSKIDYLVVAGGGGGGTGNGVSAGGGGGGGGGGGMLTGTLNSISESTDLTIVVGAGGAGGSGGNTVANNGEDSFIKADGAIDGIIAIGGGAGGSAYSQDVANGSAGGSGGGAAGTNGSSAKLPTTGGTCVEGQGFVGGDRTSNTTSNRPGAGGGGAGEAGITITTANTNNRGHGGDGRYSYITGAQVWYAGGGGGGTYGTSNDNNGLGGAGGGGAGGNYTSAPGSGVPGTNSTGGGGGGARGYRQGGNGGSGIVVLRYALNNDNFQGIVVDTTTEKFGTPSPVYDIYKELPSNSAFTCPKYTVLSDGARATCIGWELYGWNEEGEEYLIRSDTFDAETPPYEETDLSKTITFTRNDSEKGVILKWKFVKEYYVSTVVSCERGSLVADKSGWYREGDTIQVAITSMDNFIGWGGWGNGTQRSIEPSKTITVVAAPMAITAYFTAHDKDNLVLNGDFEINNDVSYSANVIQSSSRLIAGTWSIVQQGRTDGIQYPVGILASGSTGCEYSALKVYGNTGLSVALASGRNSTKSRDGIIETTVKIHQAGRYKFSCDSAAGGGSNVKFSKWKIKFVLIDESDNEIDLGELEHQADSFQRWNKPYEAYCDVRRAGTYRLRISLLKDSVQDNDPNDANAPKEHAHSALDNIRLCLDKRFGFFIKVR